MQSSDVLMAVESSDADLLHMVNTLLKRRDRRGREALERRGAEDEVPVSTRRFLRNDEGKEGAELTERSGNHDSCETV